MTFGVPIRVLFFFCLFVLVRFFLSVDFLLVGCSLFFFYVVSNRFKGVVLTNFYASIEEFRAKYIDLLEIRLLKIYQLFEVFNRLTLLMVSFEPFFLLLEWDIGACPFGSFIKLNFKKQFIDRLREINNETKQVMGLQVEGFHRVFSDLVEIDYRLRKFIKLLVLLVLNKHACVRVWL